MNPKSETRKADPLLAKFMRAWLILAFIVVLAGAYYFYANYFNRPTADVYVAQRGTAISAVYGTVSIQPDYQLPVNAQNTGYLHYDKGYLGTTVTSQGLEVKENQLLGTITDEANTRLLNQARIDFQAAESSLHYGPGSAGSLQSAKDKFNAYEKLPKNPQGLPQSVPRVEYEAARNEVARLESAVNNERLVLQRTVETTKGLVKSYEEQLQHAEVRSPIDGIIVGQTYNDNSFVTINSALFTIATKHMYVSGQVNEEDVGKLEAGMKAEMRLYAYTNTEFTATLSSVLPSPDANSSRYVTLLGFDNPPANLRIGLTGEMNIILGKKPNALIIPTRALLIDQVFIVKDDIVEQRTVKTGFKSLEFVEIVSGLDDGAQVIVADQDAFRTGERVRPVPINEAKPEPKKKSGK